MDTQRFTTREFGTEHAARAARRRRISEGQSVSLLAYNPDTDRYGFDVYETGAPVAEDRDPSEHYRNLGVVMLQVAGPEACMEGYGTLEPEWVGRYARQYGDINDDGTLN